MSNGQPSADHLSPEQLDRLVRQVEPSALLVPSRILRRVIKMHRGLGGMGLRVPHRKSHVLGREALLEIATLADLGLPPDATLPASVLLLPRPDSADLARTPSPQVLRVYWRLLFHAAVHHELAVRKADGRLDTSVALERLRRFGFVEAEEARAVLQQEHYLFSTDPLAVYEELTAVYLELNFFDPRHLPRFFPAARDTEADLGILAGDVDAKPLLERTRLEGAADPTDAVPPSVPSLLPEEPEEEESRPPIALRERAEEVSRQGNQVRAALLRIRAIRKAPATQAGSFRGPARREIELLVARLQKALRFPERESEDWVRCLWALAEPAARRMWTIEARLLYDLQKVCLDQERPLFAVDLVEWFVSWFRRPIQRPLPDLPLVLTVKHLRRAQDRLASSRLPDAERSCLAERLASALAAAEERLRVGFRPKLVEALDGVGLVPANAAERLARDKLVEELLDEIAGRGHLTLADLRDGLARNRLKLPDLRGPVEFFTGDPLIRVNRQLAQDLDGVYRRGEIYLRWLQRLSSVFFGTPIGRLLTLYLAIPLLGSLFILKGIDFGAEEIHKFVVKPLLRASAVQETPPEPEPDPFADWDLEEDEPVLSLTSVVAKASEAVEKDALLQTFNLGSFVGVAVFLLLLIHVRPFRRFVWLALEYLWRAIWGLLYQLPAGFFRLPWMQAFFSSRAYLLFYQFAGKPIVLGLPVVLVLRLCRVPWTTTLGLWAALTVGFSLVINSRVGVILEETTTDWLVRTGQLIRDDLVPGLFRWLLWLSRRLEQRIETIRYTVEEWLLFRRGQGRLSFVLKLVFGFPWFLISYVTRFILVVLFEPQVNPVKHFPVVTVMHKLTFVLVPPLAVQLAPVFGWSVEKTYALLSIVQFSTPGFFGFLAWELEENWRLYRANQSPTLDPEPVGSHGEHVIHFIRPGFHSGTLPRLFARLRRSRGAAERKDEIGLHHVEEELHRFVQRELIAPLSASKVWNISATVAVGHVHLATNRIQVELCCPGVGSESCWLELANRGGWLVARLGPAGWLATLPREALGVFVTALTGFYERSGVDLVENHLDSLLPAGFEYEIAGDHLVVWLERRSRRIAYDLLQPARAPEGGSPELPASAGILLYRHREVTWAAWVNRWEQDQGGQEHEPPLLPGMVVLPLEQKPG